MLLVYVKSVDYVRPAWVLCALCTMSSKGHSLSKLYVILPRALSNPTQPYRRCNGTVCNHIYHRHHLSKRLSQECKTTLCICHLESKLMSDAMSIHCSQKAIKHGMIFQTQEQNLPSSVTYLHVHVTGCLRSDSGNRVPRDDYGMMLAYIATTRRYAQDRQALHSNSSW